ncbi:MAG: PRC-barrel domain-containing protein [Acetobacteraceae bacterium]|nr:PRC-barrel domain-containing protein [Acetobacteraceae bacterium]
MLAQTANAPATNAASPNATSANSTNAANNTSNVQFWTQDNGNEWRTSKLKGLNVYNQNNEKLGSIDDILIDQSGQIKAVVIGVGGFLGLGEHNVAVPFNQLQFTYNNDNRNTAMGMTTGVGGNTMGTQARNDAGNPSTANMAATGLGSPATGTNANTATSTQPPLGTSTASNNNPAMANRDNGAPDRAVLNATRDQLKNAPEFKYNRG